MKNDTGIVGKKPITRKNAQSIDIGVGLDLKKNDIVKNKEAVEAIRARKDNDD